MNVRHVVCSVIGEDYVEKTPDVTAVGSLVEVKDPKALRARRRSCDAVTVVENQTDQTICSPFFPFLTKLMENCNGVVCISPPWIVRGSSEQTWCMVQMQQMRTQIFCLGCAERRTTCHAIHCHPHSLAGHHYV